MLNNIRNKIYQRRKQLKKYYNYNILKLIDVADSFVDPIVNLFAKNQHTHLKNAICLLCKDENEYLDEWLDYHRSIGFNHFFIYDNNSAVPISETLSGENDCTVTLWHDDVINKQMRAYYDCCIKNIHYEWILFIDTDEFLILKKDKNIQDFLKKYKHYHAIGLNWICYTSSGFENRVEWYKYDKHIPLNDIVNRHIKSFVKPRYVKSIPLDPHKFPLITVDEHKKLIDGPLLPKHTSDIAYIRHNITRSKNEYIKKITRGRGDGMPTIHSMDIFNLYEKQAV